MVLFLTVGLHIHGDEVLSLSWLWVVWAFCRQELEVEEAVDSEKRTHNMYSMWEGLQKLHTAARTPGCRRKRALYWPFVLHPHNVQGHLVELECKRCNISTACHKVPGKKMASLLSENVVLSQTSILPCDFGLQKYSPNLQYYKIEIILPVSY